MKSKIVLHLAAHMGGGVGKVLSNVALAGGKYTHKIVLLEAPMDTCFTDKLDDDHLVITPSRGHIMELISEADIVQVDWWNHPLMAGLMHDIQNIGMRLVVWSHTAGNRYPYLKPDFVTLPHHFIFSSLYSKDNLYWNLKDIAAMKNTSVINSSGGFADTENVPLVKHDGFNVGYVGTLAYVKLLPEFVSYCAAVADVPGIKFVMIGRIPNPNQILADAEDIGIADKFVFKGYVQDLPSELAQLDVLGYLLNPNHFGTTENAMLEVMSMGILPVCMSQCAEGYLVKNGRTGILVRNKSEYNLAICALHSNPRIRYAMGMRAREYVLNNLNLGNTIERLNDVYDKVMMYTERCFDFDSVIGKTPYGWYHAGLPPSGLKELSKHLQDSTKGSVKQWQKYYPEDIRLARMVE